jgi:hypothetical protein
MTRVIEPNTPSTQTVRIRITPDESTQKAMKQFESEAFAKKVAKDAKMISTHKIKP